MRRSSSRSVQSFGSVRTTASKSSASAMEMNPSYPMKTCSSKKTFSAMIRPERTLTTAVSQAGLASEPIKSRLRASLTSGIHAKGGPDREPTLAPAQRVGRIEPYAKHDQRRRQSDRPSKEERDLPTNEALHHDLTRHRAYRRRRVAGGEQRNPEDGRRPGGDDLLQPIEGALDAVDSGQTRDAVEERRGHDHHREVHGPRQGHRDHHVDPLEPKDLTAFPPIASHDAALGERRVEVDHVRHDGRTDDPRRQQDAFGVAESGGEEVLDDLAAVGVGVDDLEGEGRDDDP